MLQKMENERLRKYESPIEWLNKGLTFLLKSDYSA